MNLIIPQTYEAAAEVRQLMGVGNCMLTPQNNKPVMGIVQDSLLLSRILSSRDTFLTKDQICQIVGFTTTFNFNLPPPSILKPVPMWTGKQVFSCILPKINHLSYSNFHPDFEDMKDKEICAVLVKQFKDTTTLIVEPNTELPQILGNCQRTSS